MYRCLVFVFFILSLSACSSIQIAPYDQNSTLLVIPKSHENSSMESWSRTWKFDVRSLGETSDINFDVWFSNSSDAYIAINDLPPGRYEVGAMKFKMASRWRSTSANDDGYPLNIEFEVKQGEVTVFPYMTTLFQETSSGGTRSSFSVIEMESVDYNLFKVKLLEDERMQPWLINEQVIRGASI